MAERPTTKDLTHRDAIARPLLLGLLIAAFVSVHVLPLVESIPDLGDVTVILFSLPFLAVGCLILLRAGWHRMGWLVVATGIALAVALVGVPGVPPESQQLTQPWTTVFALFTYITLVFPTGRLNSWEGWRATLARLVVGLLGIFVLGEAVGLTITLLRGEIPVGPVWDVVFGVGYVGTLVLLVGGAVSLVFRFRRSTGELRAQLSWVVAALTLVMATLILTELAAIFVTEVLGMSPVDEDALYVGVGVSFFGLPVAFMVAILRYRLYDLGRLARRTVTYAVVVAVLAAVYSLGVLGLSSLIGRGSPLVVAGSTLAAAAVFNPVRHRVQWWLERRFDRQRYDTQRLVDEFTSRLRDHVDLEGLIPDLTDLVSTTLRPTSMSLWLRERAPR